MKKTGVAFGKIAVAVTVLSLTVFLWGCTGTGKSSEDIFHDFLHNNLTFSGTTYSERYAEEVEITGEQPPVYLYDVNEDGDDELLVYTMFYGCDIYDVVNGELSLLDHGEGTTEVCDVCKHEDHVYVSHSDFTHQGRRYYNVKRYNAAGEVVEEHDINAEFWDAEDDMYHEDSDFTYDGEKITEEEYEDYMKSYQMVDPSEMKVAEVLSR